MSTLTPEMLANLKAELLNDPANRGYADADSAAKAELFNNPYKVMVAVDANARVSQVLTQAFAPNAVSAEDIDAALAS